jgi:glycosyltransferase involved in cell wall biosynthesis
MISENNNQLGCEKVSVCTVGFDEKISIVIPAYNESEGITSTLDKLCNEDELAQAEIIVIDDGSTDDTSEKAKLYNRVRLIRHPVNKGYGSALITGTKNATREFVLWFDADGQHRVEDLLAVARTLTENDLDYCVGVRDRASHQVPNRAIGKWVLKKVVKTVARQDVPDFNSGLRGIRRAVLNRYLHLLSKGFGASTTMTLLMIERGYKGSDVPITVLKREGKSSVRQIRDGLRTLLLILRILILFRPLYFFGIAGLFLVVIGLLYGFWVTFRDGMGFPIMGALVFLSGIQTLFLGLVVDQISAMRRERLE